MELEKEISMRIGNVAEKFDEQVASSTTKILSNDRGNRALREH